MSIYLNSKTNNSLALEKRVLCLDKENASKTNSIKVVQTFLRTVFAKNEVEKLEKRILPRSLYDKAVQYIENPSKLELCPTIEEGASTVYAPKTVPLILKKNSECSASQRLCKMKLARKICEENGYTHLLIPRASIYHDFVDAFIIEDRLPVKVTSTKEAIGFYTENFKLFDEAVKEFTGFLCQADIEDIIGSGQDAIGQLPDNSDEYGRYDNIKFCMEKGKGKIGLVDLEHLKPKYGKYCFKACQQATILFPYHLKEIIEVAKQYDPEIESYRNTLERFQKTVLDRFKLVHTNHLNFIQKYDNFRGAPILINRITEEQIQKINLQLKRLIKRLNKDKNGDHHKCLGDKPKKQIRQLKKTEIPQIIPALLSSISKIEKQEESKIAKQQNSSLGYKLLAKRTIVMDCYGNSNYNLSEFNERLENLSSKLKSSYKVSIKSLVTDLIFNTLKEEDLIAYFNPKVGWGSTRKVVFI